jgi:predicted solute-binding protein
VSGRHPELVDALLEERLDAAFIPAIAAQKWGKKLAPLGGWGLTSAGTTETALLLAPRRIDLIDGESVAIMPGEVGSTADHLLRTLITPYYGITLKLLTHEDDGYAEASSRLTFGNEAVKAGEAEKANGKVAEDLGLAWWVLTGLPMVWEMLCHPRTLEENKPGAITAIQSALKSSQRAAAEQANTVVEAAAAAVSLKPDRLKELFARQTYTLGNNEQKGLATFLDMAGRAKAG